MSEECILVICEEKEMRQQIARAVYPIGIHVEVSKPETSLEIIKNIEFKCILLDLDISGLQVASTIRTIRKNQSNTPIVVIASNPMIPSAAWAMSTGAADFIQKPFTPAALRERITRVLEREKLLIDEKTGYYALIELAKQQMLNSRYSAAKSTLHRAIANQPREPEAYDLLGMLHEMQGELVKAKNFYKAAVEIAPEYKPAQQNLSIEPV